MQLATLCRLFFCVALAGCTTGATFNELVDSPTPLAPDVVSTVKAEEFEGHSFKSTAGSTLRYRLLKPSKLEPGKVYPLVVQLHGSGGIGTDNLSQLERMAKSWAMPELRKRYQAFILIPQFPIRSANYGPAAPDQFAISSPALQDAVELVKEFSSANPIDPTRIYATGFSMGGSASWLLPVLAPDLFAAIVPISGVAPKSEQAKDFLDLPVYAVHGTADTENPIYADRRFVAAIVSQGGQRAKLREYNGLEHQPPADMYPGLWWRDWLFSQQRN